MKILYLTSQSPWPPIVGSRMRSSGILRMLTQRSEVTVALLSSAAPEITLFKGDPQALAGGQVVAATQPRRLQHWRSITHERYRPIFKSETRGVFTGGLRELIRRESPDLLWFFRFDTVWKAGCDRYEAPVICDVDDYETKAHRRAVSFLPAAKRILATLDYPLFARAQHAAAKACDLLLVSNSDDVEEASQMTGRAVRVAPNGYDYSTPPDYEQQREHRIVFFGALNYRPNADGLSWFVRDIWPRIRTAIPDVRLDVAGVANPAVQFLDQEPGVHLCGFVDSIRSFVDHAALLVVPLRMGGGTRIKILEAWALGLPVVSTTLGCEGLDAVDGESLLISDDPDSFSRACIDLVRSPDLGVDLTRRAFDFARTRYDWEALAPQMEEAIQFATQQKCARQDR